MRCRLLYELKRHNQCVCHLRIDQRFREQNHPLKIRGRDARVLYGTMLEAEQEQYMDLDVPGLCRTQPFYYNVVEGKFFTYYTETSRIRIQIELLLSFFKSGAQLWALEQYWNQVKLMTGHSASTADFNYSSSNIAVSIILICNFSQCGVGRIDFALTLI